MRKLLLFLILIFISFTLFGIGSSESSDKTVSALGETSTWFSPFSAALNINLENTGLYDGADGQTHNNNGLADYSDAEMIANIGIRNPQPGAVYTVQYKFEDFANSGKDWVYTSLSNREYQVPFGLDLIVKGRKENDYAGEFIAKAPYRMGYQPSGRSATTNNSITITAPNDVAYASVFADIVIVLPEDKRKEFLIGNADDYQAGFSLQILENNTLIGSYSIMLTGYYGSIYSGSNDEVMFAITPDANAYAIDIAGLFNGNTYEIGNYFFSTSYMRGKNADGSYYNYTEGNKPNYQYYIFASSSPSPTSPGGFFVMKHEDVPDSAQINSQNGFYYEIGLKSAYPDGNESTIWFNGESYFDNPEVIGNRLQIKERFEKMTSGDGNTLSYFDDGEILIRMNKTENGEIGVNPQSLSAGVYRSNIYVHVVSNK